MLLESLQARGIHRGAENFRNYADLASGCEGRRLVIEGDRQPGAEDACRPAVIITPWNAPWVLSTWKLAPALAAGNTVILKPAEWAPLSASLLADLVEQAGLPPGVLNRGPGDRGGGGRGSRVRPTGASHLVTAPGDRPPHRGRRRPQHRPLHRRTGGKGPFLVFADSDLEAAARKAAGQYDDAGQVCLAGTRLIVEEIGSSEFLELFNRFTDEHVLGDSRSPQTTISPLIHPDHWPGWRAS